jgi:hypothetical protein
MNRLQGAGAAKRIAEHKRSQGRPRSMNSARPAQPRLRAYLTAGQDLRTIVGGLNRSWRQAFFANGLVVGLPWPCAAL